MTRDNLKKRHMNKPEDCVFCSEPETINHLFFDCIVAKNVWCRISSFFGKNLGSDLASITHYWIANKAHTALNSICAAVLWSLWTLRNDMIFNGLTWLSLKQIWWIILRNLRRWQSIFTESMTDLVELFCQFCHQFLLMPLQIEPS